MPEYRCLRRTVELEPLQDAPSSNDHSFPGLFQEIHRAFRPTSDVGEAVITRVEPDRVAHDVGDGLDLNLGDLFRARELVRVKQRAGGANRPDRPADPVLLPYAVFGSWFLVPFLTRWVIERGLKRDADLAF